MTSAQASGSGSVHDDPDETRPAAPPPPPTGDARGAPQRQPRRFAPYWFLALGALVAFAADVATKAWATGHLQPGRRGQPLVLIQGCLSLNRAENHGGAWGLFQHKDELLQRPFFLIVNVVAMVFIVSLYRRLTPGQSALKWGLPLVLGGALGNVADRIRFGHVVDFIDMYAGWGGQIRHWPTYNVADIAISVGVGLMALDMLWPRRRARTSGAAASATDRPAPPLSDDVEHAVAPPLAVPGAPA
jgi:signal peptidase II